MNRFFAATKTLADFRREDRGSATMWNLFWLLGFGVLLGLGLDTTNAMNMKGKLQTVADVASHAAAMDLFPDPNAAIGTALAYTTENIDNSDVVTTSDVTVGYWDRATRTFESSGVSEYNAVRVVAARDTSRDNALKTFFLKLAGFYDWDIKSVATALYYSDMSQTDRCRKDGLFAQGTVEQTSNNAVIGGYCMHGEGGIKISQNNVIQCGVEISLPNPSLWQNQSVPTPSGTSSSCSTDYSALSNDQMVEQVTVYRSIRNNAYLEYKNVKKILKAYTSGKSVNDPFNAIPPYITNYQPVDLQKFNSDAKNGKLAAGTLYVVSCAGTNKHMEISGIVRNIGVYTDCIIDVAKDKDVSAIKPQKVTGNYDKKNLCDPDQSDCSQVPWDAEIPPQMTCQQALATGLYESYPTLLDTAPGETYRDGITTDTVAENCAIEPGANGLWDNVFIFTTAWETGDWKQKAITFPNNMQIGRLDGCTEGGAVRIYAAGSMDTPSGTIVHGSHFILLGDTTLAAKASGGYGLTVEAAGDITYSAQGIVGGCSGAEKDLSSDVVVTVRPIALVQ